MLGRCDQDICADSWKNATRSTMIG